MQPVFLYSFLVDCSLQPNELFMQANEQPWVGRIPDWLAAHHPAATQSANANLLPMLRYEHRAAIPENTLPNAESCTLEFITVTVDNVPNFGCVAFTYERRSYKHRGKGKYWYWSMCRAEQIAPPSPAAINSSLAA